LEIDEHNGKRKKQHIEKDDEGKCRKCGVDCDSSSYLDYMCQNCVYPKCYLCGIYNDISEYYDTCTYCSYPEDYDDDDKYSLYPAFNINKHMVKIVDNDNIIDEPTSYNSLSDVSINDALCLKRDNNEVDNDNIIDEPTSYNGLSDVAINDALCLNNDNNESVEVKCDSGSNNETIDQKSFYNGFISTHIMVYSDPMASYVNTRLCSNSKHIRSDHNSRRKGVTMEITEVNLKDSISKSNDMSTYISDDQSRLLKMKYLRKEFDPGGKVQQ